MFQGEAVPLEERTAWLLYAVMRMIIIQLTIDVSFPTTSLLYRNSLSLIIFCMDTVSKV